MGNLDFANQPGFSWYCVFLLISGVALIVVALLPRLAGGNHAVNLVVGLLLGGYGFYLTFLWDGGTYYMFYYVFLVPVMLIVNAFKSVNQNKGAKEAYVAQQQANQAQYAAWQQSQAQAQAQAQAQPQNQQLPAIPGQTTAPIQTVQSSGTAAP
jgi:hypothetical protein